MSKDDAISIMNGSNLVDRKGVLYFLLILYIKNEWMRWFNLLSKKPRRDTK